MAMLAEPRQRKRFNLVPRGKPLYEDESRFGTKMLEKMGWTKGQGLGVNEDGTNDFVRVKYKNDSLGLGFKDRDDQWTQHEQSFNGLLQTLNNKETNEDLNTNQENCNEFEDDMPRIGFGFQSAKVTIEKTQKAGKLKEKISGVSLEERSKQSKARVHYKKFTKGKDLAQYSEKDLANIFGKKPLDDQGTNDSHINTGVSVNDYFKTKMVAIKNQKNGVDIGVRSTYEETIPNTDDVTRNEKVKHRMQEDDRSMKTTTNSQITYSNVSVNDYFKKKMEAVKTKKSVLNTEEINLDTNNYGENVQEETTKKKKKSKKDKSDEENSVEGEKIQNIKGNSAEETATKITVEIKKEKKSKKRDLDDTADSAVQERKHKKKKNKSKNKIEDDIIQHNELINTASVYPKTKKRKYEVSTEEYTTENFLDEPQTDLTQEPAKKKQKKYKTKETNEIIDTNSSANEIPAISENQTSVDKIKKNSIASNQTENILTQPSKKSKKAKRKDVSSHAKNVFITDVSNQELDVKDERNRYKEFNIFSISSFCAEKFRNINLNDFTGSSLPQIEGYGLDSELQLNVQIDKNDEDRITNLWSCALNKYYQIEKPKKTYQQYVREVITSRKTQKKRPKLYIKTWQRKNAFQML